MRQTHARANELHLGNQSTAVAAIGSTAATDWVSGAGQRLTTLTFTTGEYAAFFPAAAGFNTR